MSINSELTRIRTNISNAYAKVKAKGGTLPTNQNSDNLATAIDSIVTGGGGSTIKVEHGKATLSGTNLLTINHTLGKKPDFVFVWDNTTSGNSQKTHMIVYDSSVNTSYGYYQYYRSGARITKSVSTTKGSTSYLYIGADAVTLPYYSSTYTFSGTYNYIIGTYS